MQHPVEHTMERQQRALDWQCIGKYGMYNILALLLMRLLPPGKNCRVTLCSRVRILLGDLPLGSPGHRTCGYFGIARSTMAFLACSTYVWQLFVFPLQS